MEFTNEEDPAKRALIDRLADEIEIAFESKIDNSDLINQGAIILALELVAARILTRILVSREGAVGRVSDSDARLGIRLHQFNFAKMVAYSLSKMKLEWTE